MELGRCLEGVVHGDQEGRLADCLQHLPLCPCVLRCLLLLHNVCLLQDLHGIEVATVWAPDLPYKEHLPVG